MSIAPEAALAKEAGLSYAAIALSTDYDSGNMMKILLPGKMYSGFLRKMSGM